MKADKAEAKDNSSLGDASMEKRRRKRHKKIILDVSQQIEFYFSDANLRKDRFLKQEMSKNKDGYVSVETIANFNKMLSMTEDRKEVVSAIQLSKILKLSDDQLFVKRTAPLEPPKYDPDDCTVYVECIPKKADHDWLRKTFSYCGKVLYVSLPRYKSTSDIKGFAFIEFESPTEASRACQLLNNPSPNMMDRAGKFPKMRGTKRIVPLEFDQSKGFYPSSNQPLRAAGQGLENCSGGRLGTDANQASGNMGRSDLMGRLYGGQGKQKRKIQSEDGDGVSDGSKRLKDSSSGEDKNTSDGPRESSDSPKGLKRKRMVEPDLEGHTSSRKGASVSESLNADEEADGQVPKTLQEAKRRMMKRKRSLSEGDMWSVREMAEDEDGDGDDPDLCSKAMKKLRGDDARDAVGEGVKDEEKKKRNRKKKLKKIQEEEETHFLRVISKREWLLLKEEYLDLQRESLAQMKQAKRSNFPMPIFRKGTQTAPKVCDSDTLQPKNEDLTQSTTNEPAFTAGTVMKLECLQSGVSRKEVKEHLQAISPVAYVELLEGHTQGFVRFESADGPKAVLQDTNIAQLASQHLSLSLVTGVAEKAYWEKLSRDRQIKLGSKQKKKKKRGVNKTAGRSITEKETAHIRFDD
ncbi:la-related protein 7-like [Lytechinus pictus]|uniref:la-related protein 7-like n=1 Tax=Lytechinus pictus TaxID=7653 RepID=UPI0030B9CFEF